jgi:hypothetical protein
MHLQTILLTFFAIAIAAVHSAPVPQSFPSISANPSSALERRGDDSVDSVLEGLQTAFRDASKAKRLAASDAEAEDSRAKADAAFDALQKYKKEVKERALKAAPDDVRQAYEAAEIAFIPALADYEASELSHYGKRYNGVAAFNSVRPNYAKALAAKKEALAALMKYAEVQ